MKRVLVLAVVCLAACDGRSEWEARARRTRELADARVAEITLPTAPGELPVPVATDGLARLILGVDGVDLDRSPLVSDADFPVEGDALARALALPAPSTRIASIVDGELELPGTVDSSGHATARPLGDAIEGLLFRRTELREVSVFADRRSSTRVLAATLALLADFAGTTRAELVVSQRGSRLALPLAVRRLVSDESGNIVDPLDDLELEIVLRAEGVTIRVAGGVLQPGCDRASLDTITVPLVAGALDGPALTACAERVSMEFPGRVFHLRASNLTLDAVLPVLAALAAGANASARGVVLLPGLLAQSSGAPSIYPDLPDGEWPPPDRATTAGP